MGPRSPPRLLVVASMSTRRALPHLRRVGWGASEPCPPRRPAQRSSAAANDLDWPHGHPLRPDPGYVVWGVARSGVLRGASRKGCVGRFPATRPTPWPNSSTPGHLRPGRHPPRVSDGHREGPAHAVLVTRVCPGHRRPVGRADHCPAPGLTPGPDPGVRSVEMTDSTGGRVRRPKPNAWPTTTSSTATTAPSSSP